MLKKLICFLMSILLTISCSACSNQPEETKEVATVEPKVSQMKAICELAVMDCYYHNVAKSTPEDTSGFWIFKKDKTFWIEYSGTVTLGIDISKVNIEINGTEITIELPQAKVLDYEVDADSLTEDSYIFADKSAKASADDAKAALEDAKIHMKETASNDATLLASAQQRAQILLEDYITNIGNAVGTKYTINWIYLENA